MTRFLESARLFVIPEKTAAFEERFASAMKIISAMKGFLGMELQQNLAVPTYIFYW